MSFLKFLFDSDYAQRRDIEELREMQYKLAAAPSGGGASEKWVLEIADEVKELAATVRVLMRKLAEANLLDVAAIRDEVAEELRPKPRGAQRSGEPADPGIPMSCTKCNTHGRTGDMVKVGAAWLCRPCARNP